MEIAQGDVKGAMTRLRRSLVLDAPVFGSLSLGLELIEDRATKTMATDGRYLWFGPAFVQSLPRRQVLGVIVHEVLHCAMGHPWRRGHRDLRLWNEACDYAVNLIVMEAGFELPPKMLLDGRFRGMSAETIYDILLAEQQRKAQEESRPPPSQQEDGGEQDGGNPDAPEPDDEPDDNASNGEDDGAEEGQGDDDEDGNERSEDGEEDAAGAGQPDSGDDTNDDEASDGRGDGLAPDDGDDGAESAPPDYGCGEVRDAPPEAREEVKAQWATAVTMAAHQADKAGMMTPAMRRLFAQAGKPPQDWRALLLRFAQSCRQDDYSWRRPSPQYLVHGMFVPSQRSEGLDTLVLLIDTSGSIDGVLLGQFGEEINAVADELKPETVYVVYGDTEVQRVDEFHSGEPIEFNPVGSGGTDFQPLFAWIAQEGITPDCAVLFTDMQGPFPEHEPDYPVLIANTGGDWARRYYAPSWGEIVDLV